MIRGLISAPDEALPTLDEEISGALSRVIPAADVAALVPLIEDEIANLGRALDLARRNSLDPRAERAEATAYRIKVSDLTYDIERLAVAEQAIRTRVAELARAEKDAADAIERKSALAERDEIAERIGQEIPDLIRRWIEIVRLIDESDSRLAGAGLSFESAEIKARGYPGNGYWPEGAGAVQRMRDAKLPAFDRPGLAWGERHGAIIAADAGD